MAKKPHPKYVYVDGRPAPYDIAPYIYLVLRRAGQTASSIYRGSDAARMLHRYGAHTQAEIHRMLPAISNPEGYSQHDLHSDGVGNPRVPRGARLEPWQVGVDSGTNDQAARDQITRAAAHYGWHVKHPYSRGVEGHHWCFAVRPHPNRFAHRVQIALIRRRLVRASR